MKIKILLSILALCIFAATTVTQAQFPNFTKVDTGAVTQLSGGHVTSTCYDMDNDGDLDIASSNNGVYVDGGIFSRFKNERNGYYVKMPQFIDSTDFRNVRSFGDIDNDGDIDLFRGSLSGSNLKFYTNNGYGSYQLSTSLYLPDASSYPALIDLNNDGFLDIVGINIWGSVLYNNGSGGFLPWTDLGLFQEQTDVYLHGVSWGDADDDGDFDFYGGYSPSNEYGIPINLCYLNDGNGAFVQFDPTSPILEDTCFTTCANWLDYDNDGDMDLYVHNVGCEGSLSALYENLGDMQFTKHDFIDEIYRYSWANSAVWGDLDNDGDLDLFISIENNPFPFPWPWPGDPSATPFNVLYINEGNGQFTNFLEEHPLVTEDSHTALLLDHDNDGDLDVLMTRYSWSNDGYNNLFVNEGNDNSWMVLTCEGTTSNRSAIGTHINAKALVNGSNTTQTREITPINGHLSYANLRVHFGMGNANVIDTLIIRWPSGNVDTYLDVAANQFYRAIEDEELTIDFKATNYIQYDQCIAPDTIGWHTSIDLKDHFAFIEGDTVPVITGDTLTFSVFNNEDPGVVQATIEGSILTLEAISIGETTIEILASAGFTERLESFVVHSIGTLDIAEQDPNNPAAINSSPNPFTNETIISYELLRNSKVRLEIYNHQGKLITTLVDENKSLGKHEIQFNGKELPAGVYYCLLKINEGIQTTKIIKLK